MVLRQITMLLYACIPASLLAYVVKDIYRQTRAYNEIGRIIEGCMVAAKKAEARARGDSEQNE